MNAFSASQSRAADSTSVSSTGWSSNAERLMTFSTSAVAVCCSSDSRSSLSSRAFSMAMTPEALEIPEEVVLRALRDTEDALAQRKQQEDEERRIIHEKEEMEWRAAFRPHAILQTENTRPSSITMCGITGGPRRWLRINFDLSKPPVTFVQQALAALPEKARKSEVDGRWHVMFFGEVLGFIVNYSPEKALRCDLDGQPLEVLPKAYRPGDITLSIGGKRVSPTVMARVLGTAPT
jgi:hypothetical protein